MKRLLSILVISALSLVGSSLLDWANAAQGDKRGDFPVRECDESTPFSVIYPVLIAGMAADESQGYKDYLKWVTEDRKNNEKGLKIIKDKEWPNLRSQAENYMAHDKYGFKAWVVEMNPGDVDKKTQKVYFTLRNFVFPDDRQGLMIVERDRKGNWKLKSLSL